MVADSFSRRLNKTKAVAKCSLSLSKTRCCSSRHISAKCSKRVFSTTPMLCHVAMTSRIWSFQKERPRRESPKVPFTMDSACPEKVLDPRIMLGFLQCKRSNCRCKRVAASTPGGVLKKALHMWRYARRANTSADRSLWYRCWMARLPWDCSQSMVVHGASPIMNAVDTSSSSVARPFTNEKRKLAVAGLRSS